MTTDRSSSARKRKPAKRSDGARKRAPGEHIGLDRRQIIEVATQMVEEAGAGALNVRELAERMGVTPAAVYWHVKSREELFDEIVKSVFNELTPPRIAKGDWRERTRALLLWFRQRLTERAALLSAVASSAALPFAFVHVGIALAEILGDAAFDADERRAATRALMGMTIGQLLFESSNRAQWQSGASLVDMEQAAQRLGQDQLVSLVKNLSHMRDFDFDGVFRYSLDRMLEGLATRVPKRRK